MLPEGVKVGILMGSAYLFTKEIVESGAIVEQFQKELITKQEAEKKLQAEKQQAQQQKNKQEQDAEKQRQAAREKQLQEQPPSMSMGAARGWVARR